jgi:hypothetical protein
MAQDGGQNRSSIVAPIILIVIGVLFLLKNWQPNFDPWNVIWNYWPLILIFIGIGKIWDNAQRRKNPNAPPGISIGSTIAILAVVLLLVAFVSHGRSYRHNWGGSNWKVQHTSQTVNLQKAKTANAKIDMGAGQLTIHGGAKEMLDADFSYTEAFGAPKVDYSVSDGVAQLNISQDSHGVNFGRSENDWNLHFNSGIPLDLRIEMGAGQGNLYFRDVPLTQLNLHLGAGQVDVDLTGERKTNLEVDIEGGVGQANIRLPKNVGVIAKASGGIGSVDTHGLKKEGDEYVNDAYGKSPVTIHLTVQGGIGEIQLTQEP